MSERKIFLTDEKTTVFTCPKCEYSTTRDVSKYKELEKAVKVKCKCRCGHVYSVLLERREYFRKKVDLPGVCIFGPDKRKTPMTVKDMSRIGLKLEVEDPSGLKAGDKVLAEFNLDDKKKSLIRKMLVIRTISGNSLGAKFCSIEPGSTYDTAIRFYMFS